MGAILPPPLPQTIDIGPGGGGGRVFELNKLLISPSIFLFSFLRFFFYIYKVGSKTRLSVIVGFKGTSEARLTKFRRHVMMPSAARQNFFFEGY